MAGTYYNSHCNHAYHDNPSFYVEEGKWTMLPFLLRDAEGVFLVQPMENDAEEQKEYQAGFTDFE